MARRDRRDRPIGSTPPEEWLKVYGERLYDNQSYGFAAAPRVLLVALDAMMPVLKQNARMAAKQCARIATELRDRALPGVRKYRLRDLLSALDLDSPDAESTAPPLPPSFQPGPAYTEGLASIVSALRATEVAAAAWEKVAAAMGPATLTTWRGNVQTDQVCAIASLLKHRYRGSTRSDEAMYDDVVTVCETYGVDLGRGDRAAKRKRVAAILTANPTWPARQRVKRERSGASQKPRPRGA